MSGFAWFRSWVYPGKSASLYSGFPHFTAEQTNPPDLVCMSFRTPRACITGFPKYWLWSPSCWMAYSDISQQKSPLISLSGLALLCLEYFWAFDMCSSLVWFWMVRHFISKFEDTKGNFIHLGLPLREIMASSQQGSLGLNCLFLPIPGQCHRVLCQRQWPKGTIFKGLL